MEEFGIIGFGSYVPRLRMERKAIADSHRSMVPSLKGLGRGERAFCSWDEDAITMAVEAVRDCLDDRPRDKISAITMASTSFPYASLQNSVIAAGALALGRKVRTSDVGGSQRAGVSGLANALRGGGEQIFVASDRLNAKPASVFEMSYGAGAAAFQLGTGDTVATLVGTGLVTALFIDHFRAANVSMDYFWEERWIRDEGYGKLVPEAVQAALVDAGLEISAMTNLVMASPQKAAVATVAKAIGFGGQIADSLDSSIGYAGTAHSLLMLTGALQQAKPGDHILLVGFGQGAEVLILRVNEAIAAFKPRFGLSRMIADKVSSGDYLRMLSFYGSIDLESGMRGEATGKAAVTTLYRESDQLSAFVAGKCQACGTVQFPQLAYCVNSQCHAPSSQFIDYSLADEPARVLTYTSDWLSYYPSPPLYVGFVQFDIGARLLMETVDIGPKGIEENMLLRMVYRIKETDKVRSFNRYFWKSTPIIQGA